MADQCFIHTAYGRILAEDNWPRIPLTVLAAEHKTAASTLLLRLFNSTSAVTLRYDWAEFSLESYKTGILVQLALIRSRTLPHDVYCFLLMDQSLWQDCNRLAVEHQEVKNVVHYSQLSRPCIPRCPRMEWLSGGWAGLRFLRAIPKQQRLSAQRLSTDFQIAILQDHIIQPTAIDCKESELEVQPNCQ